MRYVLLNQPYEEESHNDLQKAVEQKQFIKNDILFGGIKRYRWWECCCNFIDTPCEVPYGTTKAFAVFMYRMGTFELWLDRQASRCFGGDVL